MSLTKRWLESQPTPIERVRTKIETALRAADEGSLDYPTVDLICINLIEALKQLREVEAQLEGDYR